MSLDDFRVRGEGAYPIIVDAENCKDTVSVLSDLAFSCEGELNGILTYIYQSVVTNKMNEDVAKVLEEIAVVEMTHLDMLMLAITDFGGDPKYIDDMRKPYSTTCIEYGTRLFDMLKQNIVAEEDTINNYKQAIGLVKNKSLKALFERIIKDEECHLKIFKYLLENVKFMSC